MNLICSKSELLRAQAPSQDLNAGAAVIRFRLQLLDCPPEKFDAQTLRGLEKILAEQVRGKTVNVNTERCACASGGGGRYLMS